MAPGWLYCGFEGIERPHPDLLLSIPTRNCHGNLAPVRRKRKRQWMRAFGKQNRPCAPAAGMVKRFMRKCSKGMSPANRSVMSPRAQTRIGVPGARLRAGTDPLAFVGL